MSHCTNIGLGLMLDSFSLGVQGCLAGACLSAVQAQGVLHEAGHPASSCLCGLVRAGPSSSVAMPRVAILLALAAPVCVLGRRVAEGSGSNLTAEESFGPQIPEIPALPDGTAEAIAEWWKTTNHYVGHKYVLAFADMWTIYNNILKIKSVSGQKKAAASFVVTGEYFTTLEAAQDVDRSLTSNLGIKTDGETSWNCDQYYPDEAQPKMHFSKTSFLPSETFESVNDAKCLNALRSQIGIIRWSVCHIEAQANEWADEMSKTDLKRFFLDTVRGKSCEGKPLDDAGLDAAFRARDGETCVKHKERCGAAAVPRRLGGSSLEPRLHLAHVCLRTTCCGRRHSGRQPPSCVNSRPLSSRSGIARLIVASRNHSSCPSQGTIVIYLPTDAPNRLPANGLSLDGAAFGPH